MYAPQEIRAAKAHLDRLAFGLARWTPMAGEPLELEGRPITFSSGFYSIAPGDGDHVAYWYAGAQGGPYGLANVGDAVRPDCYQATRDGRGCRITARRTPGGDPAQVGGWYSGHLQTVNRTGRGFSQRYGYFEAALRLPLEWLAWPAFWLKARDKWIDPAAVNIEIDVLEHYGRFKPSTLHSVVHHGIDAGRQWNESETITDADLTQPHRYGVNLDPEWITVYFDRRAIARHPMLDDFRRDLYPMLTLSIDSRPEQLAHLAEAPESISLDVIEVTVYR